MGTGSSHAWGLTEMHDVGALYAFPFTWPDPSNCSKGVRSRSLA